MRAAKFLGISLITDVFGSLRCWSLSFLPFLLGREMQKMQGNTEQLCDELQNKFHYLFINLIKLLYNLIIN